MAKSTSPAQRTPAGNRGQSRKETEFSESRNPGGIGEITDAAGGRFGASRAAGPRAATSRGFRAGREPIGPHVTWSGIGFISGLEGAEAPQTADALAAGLALVAVLAVGAHLLGLGRAALTTSPLLTGVGALLVGVLAVPGMLAAGGHSHAGGHSDGHDHGVTADGTEAVAAAVPPKPFDPNLPIDPGGVEGVTPQQQAAAENLLAMTVVQLPQFEDPATAESMGFVSIGDGFLGHEHYLNAANMNDERLLDPDYPESLVYDTSVTPKKLVAAMFMMNPGDTLDDVPELGGALTQWHIHDNLCFSGPRVAGLTDAEGNCGPGLTKGNQTPMIHVWIEPNKCGPFSALDGVAGGSVPEGETKLCDHVHG
jgi:hypothetical protein